MENNMVKIVEPSVEIITDIDGKKIYLNREYDKVSTEEPRNKSFRLFKRK